MEAGPKPMLQGVARTGKTRTEQGEGRCETITAVIVCVLTRYWARSDGELGTMSTQPSSRRSTTFIPLIPVGSSRLAPCVAPLVRPAVE